MSGTIVIGAGMAGVTCARALSTAGQEVRLLDKGRGIGGRMATRRITTGWGELHFDHGAQYFTARNSSFESLLIELNGSVAPWDIGAIGNVSRWATRYVWSATRDGRRFERKY